MLLRQHRRRHEERHLPPALDRLERRADRHLGLADARLALQVAHRGYVLATGEIILYGPARELAENPEVQKAYLGEG